jgi:hypothetical protein
VEIEVESLRASQSRATEDHIRRQDLPAGLLRSGMSVEPDIDTKGAVLAGDHNPAAPAAAEEKGLSRHAG